MDLIGVNTVMSITYHLEIDVVSETVNLLQVYITCLQKYIQKCYGSCEASEEQARRSAPQQLDE